jgi:hypothetical protein
VNGWPEIRSDKVRVRLTRDDTVGLQIESRAAFNTSFPLLVATAGLVFVFFSTPFVTARGSPLNPVHPIRRRTFGAVPVNRRKEETETGKAQTHRQIGGAGLVVRTAAWNSGKRQGLSKSRHRVEHLHWRLRQLDGHIPREEPPFTPAALDQPQGRIGIEDSILAWIAETERGPPTLEHARFPQSGARGATRLSCLYHLFPTERTSAPTATVAVENNHICFA